MKKGASRAYIVLFCITAITCTASLVSAARAPIQVVSKDPYAGALLIDTDTGRVLFEHNADARLYPASLTKLMTFLIVIEAVEKKQIKLKDTVTACAEAESMGGSQVYLRRGEQFSVEELLYALMIKSANDAAFALAKHVAGSRQAFIERMNQRARQLGMTNSEFHSMHGLPPSQGQKPDCTTARDIARLCRELLRHEATLRYTSTETRPFRNNEFIMRNHNPLLKSVAGCDGLKTGYYRAAGFSIAATASRNDSRVLAIVMCSRNRLVRDAEAKKLLLKGLAEPVKPATRTVEAPAGTWTNPTARAANGF